MIVDPNCHRYNCPIQFIVKSSVSKRALCHLLPNLFSPSHNSSTVAWQRVVSAVFESIYILAIQTAGLRLNTVPFRLHISDSVVCFVQCTRGTCSGLSLFLFCFCCSCCWFIHKHPSKIFKIPSAIRLMIFNRENICLQRLLSLLLSSSHSSFLDFLKWCFRTYCFLQTGDTGTFSGETSFMPSHRDRVACESPQVFPFWNWVTLDIFQIWRWVQTKVRPPKN